MGNLGAKAIVFFVGAAFVFGMGWMSGGALGTGQANKNQIEQIEQIEQCLPIADAAALNACLEGGDES